MWEEAPVLGNHWLLAGCVNLVILMAVLVAAARRRFGDRVDLANRILPAARLCLLGFYAFAAFSKLNSAFFDRTVSCAVYYFRESTASIGLCALRPGPAAWLAPAVISPCVALDLPLPFPLLVAVSPVARGLGPLFFL